MSLLLLGLLLITLFIVYYTYASWVISWVCVENGRQNRVVLVWDLSVLAIANPLAVFIKLVKDRLVLVLIVSAIKYI